MNYSKEQYSLPQSNNIPWEQPSNNVEIQSSSSYPNFIGEVELADDYGLCMSPYTVYGSYMGFYGEDQFLPFDGYYVDGHAELQRYQNPF